MKTLNKIILTGLTSFCIGNVAGQETKYFEIFPKKISGDTVYLPNGYKFENNAKGESFYYISAVNANDTIWEIDNLNNVDHLKNIIALYEGTMDSHEAHLRGDWMFNVGVVKITREGEYKGISSVENLDKICKRLTAYNKEMGIEERFIETTELRDLDDITESHSTIKYSTDHFFEQE